MPASTAVAVWHSSSPAGMQVGVQIVPVFISVDPERDTPAKIKSYVKVGGEWTCQLSPCLAPNFGKRERGKRITQAENTLPTS
eukprot:scaffold239514_cov15-Tisochrysis_lutea.AAC.1